MNLRVLARLGTVVVGKQYVTKASSCVRAALKEPAKTKSLGQEAFAYNKSMWAAGVQGEKAAIDSLKSVGK